MTAPSLRIDKLHKYYGSNHAVKNLSFDIHPSEIYALIGPNGAGKTTTVKMITGLTAPDKGTIHVNGHSIQHKSAQAKQQIGYIPDNPFIYPYLTGREFLELTGDLFELPREQTNHKINQLSKEFSITPILDNLFSDYSRGNQQKTTIISALLHEPKLLVVDEPIVGLDIESQHTVSRLFKQFTQSGGSILLCTHTLSWAQNNADKIGVLHHGQLISEGTLKELRSQSKQKNATLEELYLHFTTA